MIDHVVLHYAEIGTKAGNRAMFEKALVRNVQAAIARWVRTPVRRETGRLAFSVAGLPDADVAALAERVVRLPGVAWISPAVRTAPTLEAMSAAAVEMAARRGGSFKIQARRSEKTLPFTTLDINRVVGAAVAGATGRPVDVHGPDDTYFIEADSQGAYVHDARVPGPGGLPVGCSGRVVALLSGGIDSPVAAYQAALRGCEVHAVHLWNRTFSGEPMRDKVLAIARALAASIGPLRLELVPFDDIQREIVAASPADLRMLLYRRAMLRVAHRMRRRRKAGGIVVGDCIGQVASQTLPNLAAVYDAARPPILAPLIATNKMDVVRTAQRIGTYEASILPGEDCCSLMVARHPRTSTTAEALREIEANYPLEELVGAALRERESHVIEPA